MKKLSFLIVWFYVICLITLPQAAKADLSRMDNAQLAAISGQASIPIMDQLQQLTDQADISFEDDSLKFSVNNGNVLISTDEGVGGGTQGGSFGLKNIYTAATMNNVPEIEIDSDKVKLQNGFGRALKNSGYTAKLKNSSVHIRSFQGNLMLQDQSGNGSSLGVVGVQNLHIQTRGSAMVRVN